MLRSEHFRAVLEAFLAEMRGGGRVAGHSGGDGRQDAEAAGAGRRAGEQAPRGPEGPGVQLADGAHAASERQGGQVDVAEERGRGLQRGHAAAREVGGERAGGQLAGQAQREEQGCVVPRGGRQSSHPWELREAPLVSDGGWGKMCRGRNCAALRRVSGSRQLAFWGPPGRCTPQVDGSQVDGQGAGMSP